MFQPRLVDGRVLVDRLTQSRLLMDTERSDNPFHYLRRTLSYDILMRSLDYKVKWN